MMRRLLSPLATGLIVVVGLSIWTLQSVTQAENHNGDPWEQILKDRSLSSEDRAVIGQLRPWLRAGNYLALDRTRRRELLRYGANRLFSDSPLSRCWAPDTPLPLIVAFHGVEKAARSFKSRRKANQFFERWKRTATNGPLGGEQGTPVTLTWSIVPDGTPVAGDPAIGDSNDPSSLRARLADLYGGNTEDPENQPWFPLFQDLFDAIGAQTGITYLYEPNDDGRAISGSNPGRAGIRGDLRLCGHPIDGDGATLAYNFFPDHGDMVIDTSDSFFENLSGNSRRLVNTIAHEHGHGLGLEHVCPIDQTKLLEPFISTDFRGMQFDDIYTLQRWYGDPFEQHGGRRNNDAIERAHSLEVSAGSPFSFQWLSIDDNSDIDYYSLTLPPGARLSVRVIPSNKAYPEGGEDGQGCSAGVTFNSSIVHNLSLTLLDRTGRVLATADDSPAGESEEFDQLTVPGEGLHFLRIAGDDADAAQLYRLEVEILAPAVAVTPGEVRITSESHAPANGRIEPDETIELQITLANSGSVTAGNVSATLTAPEHPASFTGFINSRNYGTLVHQGSTSRSFTLALHGDCGDRVDLELSVTTDNGFSRSFPLPLEIGHISPRLTEDFEAPAGQPLPPGWLSSSSRSGSGWTRSPSQPGAGEHSAFAGSPPSLGISALTSPLVIIGPQGGALSFRHFVDTEASFLNPEVGFDGGVLEISRDGGQWEDIETAGGTFTQGGYTRTLSAAYQNPLPNRRAWSGSLGWIDTVVKLPSSLASRPLRFRWRLGHDTSDAEDGWYLDEVTVSSITCEETKPVIRLEVDNASTSEFLPAEVARLNFSTPLPVARDFPLPLLIEGSATPGVDTRRFDNIVFPAGQTLLPIAFRATLDTEVEGPETLTLALDPDLVFPEGAAPAIITFFDTPYGQWAASQLGLDSANNPQDDFDRDGARNAEEYFWGSNPASPLSQPRPNPRQTGSFLRIDFPHQSLPPFARARAETSTDLLNWSGQAVEILPDGFRVPLDGPTRYLRLVYEEFPPP